MRALPLAVLCVLAACGRIGFEQHEPSEATRPSGAIASAFDAAVPRPPMSGGRPIGTSAAPARRDAGPASAWDASARKPSTHGADNGAACNADADCASGACVSAVCCAQPCDQPPQCRSAEAASCSDGVSCDYPTTAGGVCDDGDPCTSGDACFAGRCRAGFGMGCDDDQTCTEDFCSRGGCEHASSCNPEEDGCNYTLRGGHGYWMCPAPVTYATADAACQRLNGHIVTVNDQDEQDFLWSHGMRDTWIGYSTSMPAADGGFGWSSGSSTFTDWAAGEPDAGEGMTCAYLSTAHGGGWSGRDCTAHAGFVCELEQHVPPDANCRYARRDDRGYFICDSTRGVLEAEVSCVLTGTTLTEIGDATEQAFLTARLTSGASYLIGMNDLASEGSFVWLSGAPAPFFAWADGQPASDSDDRDYVVMSADGGRWRTVTANDRQFFICEEPHQR
jgi:hypothetical protein